MNTCLLVIPTTVVVSLVLLLLTIRQQVMEYERRAIFWLRKIKLIRCHLLVKRFSPGAPLLRVMCMTEKSNLFNRFRNELLVPCIITPYAWMKKKCSRKVFRNDDRLWEGTVHINPSESSDLYHFPQLHVWIPIFELMFVLP